MKKTIRISVALLLAGSVLFLGGWSFGRVKKGVVVDGIPVGGLSYREAEETVRGEIASKLPPFIVHTPMGDRAFETEFRDDLAGLLRSARKGEELKAGVRREWADMEEALARLAEENFFPAEDAELTFSARGFSYRHERAGRGCDLKRLLAAVTEAFGEGRDEADLPVFGIAPAVTEEALRARTRPLASFTTSFDPSNSPRAHNIALAASRISGTVLPPDGEFSFNGTVGRRTEENGFETANIISGGEFVPGVGGGVCQVSTTLMNAALLAGLNVTESRPHSLTVGYVPPSRDAMVSEYSDLKFVNPYPVPVYISGLAGGGRVSFTVYGLPDGREYRVESKVLLVADPPPEQIVEGEEEKVIRAPKQGIASESFLAVYEKGVLLSRTLLRRDAYAVVQGIRQVKRQEEEDVPSVAPPLTPF